MAGRLLSIGAITVDYRRPNLKWSSTPTSRGIRSCSISGLVELSKAHQLSELVANPLLARTIAGFTGVLEWVVFDGDVLLPFTGYYLLQTFDINVERELMFGGLSGPIGFSLTAAYLGDLA